MTNPKQAEEQGRCNVPSLGQEVDKEPKQAQVADHLLAVLEVRACVEAFIGDAVVQCAVLFGNGLLHVLVERRIVADVYALALVNRPVGVLVGRQGRAAPGDERPLLRVADIALLFVTPRWTTSRGGSPRAGAGIPLTGGRGAMADGLSWASARGKQGAPVWAGGGTCKGALLRR